MFEMTPEQRRAFLLEGTRTGKLATTRPDGRPHVMPVWFDLDDDDSILFTTGGTSVKARNLEADPRAMMCVDDEREPFAMVTAEGPVELSQDLDEMLHWATRIGGRYMGADQADALGKRNAVPSEFLVRLRPERWLAYGGMTDD